MNSMHIAHQDLSEINLNLLVVLDALLQELSVTRAAQRIGLSQSAVSHALKRLRELLGDPLLLRTSRGMVPTPRAEQLLAPVHQTVGQELPEGFHAEPVFDITYVSIVRAGHPKLEKSLSTEVFSQLGHVAVQRRRIDRARSRGRLHEAFPQTTTCTRPSIAAPGALGHRTERPRRDRTRNATQSAGERLPDRALPAAPSDRRDFGLSGLARTDTLRPRARMATRSRQGNLPTEDALVTPSSSHVELSEM